MAPGILNLVGVLLFEVKASTTEVDHFKAFAGNHFQLVATLSVLDVLAFVQRVGNIDVDIDDCLLNLLRAIGEGLDDGSQYQQECIIEQLQADPDSGFNGDSIQQEFQLTGYEERQLFNAEDEGDDDNEEPIIVNNGWIGVDGKFTVEFYGFNISNANLNGEAVLLDDLTNVDSPTVEYGWTFSALSGNNVTLTRRQDMISMN